MKSMEKENPRVKDVLKLIGNGLLISSIFLFPGMGMGVKTIMDVIDKREKEQYLKKLHQYDTNRLKAILRRLHKQKCISVSSEGDKSVITLTSKGRKYFLKYKLLEMDIQKLKHWDGKWRLVMYDISQFKRSQQDAFRQMLKKFHMLSLQKSVYLTPYPCAKEIAFLREYFDIGEEVIYVQVEAIENESAYKEYFNL
ncbi:hypothetical protein A3D77_06500 [Candidatus Gottesmanbacteria bacterium RIFCSPHIGHO2_02_FULL_39_11]|uniref:Transcriptional repressor PaaX-like central Cas2-like domain-containing protein n=1 Tax=Candidatus Gottesmanbacteria bacterium RIFCSPHIGHO2_02_FULL_39_11 TaxID=1798382 RepID=A0A1F5ZSS6_9BACT|nr:MAG: hypothetical protein A3D77_06500 [Candidatus Gottesmanbacteria bacterium RIFCSPHIGHO2_02_FULL_39_11]